MKKLWLALVFVSTSACVQKSEPVVPITLTVKGIEVVSGSISDGAYTVLDTKDQSGTEISKDKTLAFIPSSEGSDQFNSVITFAFNKTFKASDFKGLTVKLNYWGEEVTAQKWVVKIKDNASNSWVYLFDSSFAKKYEWSSYKFPKNEIGNFVSSAGEVQLAFSSNNSTGTSLLDYLVVELSPETLVIPTPKPSEPTPVVDVPTPTGSAWWKPVPGSRWHIQYTGTFNYAALPENIKMVNLDLFDKSAEEIAALKAKGKKVMCYFSGGSYEKWRSDEADFPASVRGKDLDGWPGEKWLDVRQIEVLRKIMGKRMDLAVAKKCDGVDPDNMDGYTQNSGFTISYNEQIVYNKMIASEAHKRGLGVGLKNSLEMIKDLVNQFDWAVNESCFDYNECEMLLPFINQNKPVYGIEYNQKPSKFCSKANSYNFDTQYKDQLLTAPAEYCR